MAADPPDRYPATADRYSDVPLPETRYRPGRMPRPADRGPAGLADRFRYGVDLYNNGYWWEAHEAWEAVWLRLQPNSAMRHGVQGLIQAANCHLKIHLGQARAARSLARDLERLFDAALLHTPELTIEGLAVAPWRARVGAYFAAVLEEEKPALDAEAYPYIVLAAADGQ